jgi:phage shock protein PspC (stress-responsive transcriptional regulator)
MNKVITINLNGNAYQLEEDGYEALRAYLEAAARGLAGNPDRDEIIADIEQAIADKFRAVLGANKTVVVSKEVKDVISQMGPVQDDSGPAAGAAGQGAPGGGPAASPGAPAGAPKRLYRIREGAQLAGVCNGLAAYFGIDVTLIRILFAVCVLSFGAGVLLYIVMMFVIPAANTPEEMAAAQGIPSTAEDFIKRAREGYYGGMKAFGDRRAFKEWKRQFKRDMRRNAQQWRQDWHQRWAPGAPPHPGAWAFGSFVGIILAALSLLCVFSVISLIVTGGVLGFFPPFGMPLWLAVILVIIFFKLVKWPFRVARYGAYYGDHCCPGGPFSWFWHTFSWLILVLFLIWFANHHSVMAHDVLHRVSHEAHRAVDAVRDWWDQQ